MSHVTAVLLLTDLPEDDAQLRDELNAFGNGLLLDELSEQTGGTKHPQALIFAAGVNFLNISAFLAFLRAFPWATHDVRWAQVVLQDEHDDGFGLVEVYRDPLTASPPWREEP